jgi:hypothetical protein
MLAAKGIPLWVFRGKLLCPVNKSDIWIMISYFTDIMVICQGDGMLAQRKISFWTYKRYGNWHCGDLIDGY